MQSCIKPVIRVTQLTSLSKWCNPQICLRWVVDITDILSGTYFYIHKSSTHLDPIMNSNPTVHRRHLPKGPQPTQKPPKPLYHPHKTCIISVSAPGESFEVRQTSASDDWHPGPSKPLPLDEARQALFDKIIVLYSCKTHRRVHKAVHTRLRKSKNRL